MVVVDRLSVVAVPMLRREQGEDAPALGGELVREPCPTAEAVVADAGSVGEGHRRIGSDPSALLHVAAAGPTVVAGTDRGQDAGRVFGCSTESADKGPMVGIVDLSEFIALVNGLPDGIADMEDEKHGLAADLGNGDGLGLLHGLICSAMGSVKLLDADASVECPLIGLHERLPDIVGFGLFEGDACGHVRFDDVSVIEDDSECGEFAAHGLEAAAMLSVGTKIR